MLKRANLPAHPVYYELFYIYATGATPELNAQINELLTANGQIGDDEASELCERFLEVTNLDEKLRDLSEVMNSTISNVNASIDLAMATANSYSGSLLQASGDLEGSIDDQALQALSTRLLKETRRMQDMNRKLESQLANTKGDLAVLQSDLAKVRREAMIDPLTKIANRKGFDEQLALEMEKAGETRAPLCLLVMDIDRFKAFNDTYGHLTGDQVLRLVAQVVKANIRGRDMAARFGGEEFVAILPETELSGALTVAEHIRQAVQSKELLKRSTNEKLGRITLSLGVAQWRGAPESASALIERADKCLYAAKSGGRNRVVCETSATDAPIAS